MARYALWLIHNYLSFSWGSQMHVCTVYVAWHDDHPVFIALRLTTQVSHLPMPGILLLLLDECVLCKIYSPAQRVAFVDGLLELALRHTISHKPGACLHTGA